MRMDAKIDMLHQSSMLGKAPSKVEHSQRKSGESDARVRDLKQVSRISKFHEGLCLKQPSCITAKRRQLFGG
jgi:hypothetical protein